MKRKVFLFLGIVSCTLVLFGCSAKETKKEASAADVKKEESIDAEKQVEDTKKEEAKTPEKEVEVPEKEAETPTYPEKDAGSIDYASPLGYTCKFDPTVFTLDDTTTAECYMYQTAEKLESPVYVSVVPYKEMNVETLVDGLILQNNLEKSAVQDTTFGADGIDTKCITLEKEVNGVKLMYAYYVIPSGEGSLLVEISGYAGMPETAEHKIEEITGTFAMKK